MTPFLRGARRGENNGAGRAAVAGSRGVAPGTSGAGGGNSGTQQGSRGGCPAGPTLHSVFF
jgi:hypothetical protein